MPRVRCILLCDESAARNVSPNLCGIFFNSIVVNKCPADYSPKESSRYLKTNIRLLIDEPSFWYIDGDTALRGALPRRPDSDPFLAGCEDRTRNLYYFARPTCARAGWKLNTTVPYINSGVLYWGDSSESFSLAERWSALWKHGRQVAGISSDQPSLNIALQSVDRPPALLNPAFNCQLWIEPWGFKNAVVWHFGGEGLTVYKYGSDRPQSLYDCATKTMDPDRIRTLAEQCSVAETPWVEANTRIIGRFGDAAAKHAGSFVNQAYGALDSGEFFHAMRLLGDAVAIGWHSPRLLLRSTRCFTLGCARVLTKTRSS